MKIPKDPNEIVDVIQIKEAPQAWVDYKIRIKINGKFYTGELELSE